MNKEVKYLIEQLEEMRDYPTREEEYIVENLVMLNYNKCKVLLDYIKQLETSIATKDSELLQLKEELRQLKTNRDEAIELIKNFDVFKEFSFPLMKRDEENQVKSSIDYEFKTTLYKQLLSILERGKE